MATDGHLRMDVVVAPDSDPTVAKAMRGLSALRLLAQHLEGLRVTSLQAMPYHFADDPYLGVQLYSPAEARTLAERIGHDVEWDESLADEPWHVSGRTTWMDYPLHLAGYDSDERDRLQAQAAEQDDDEQPDREPTPEQERAWDEREDELRGHVLG